NTTRAFATFYNRTGVKEPQPAEPSFSHFSVRLFPTVAKDKLEIEYSSNEGQKVRIYGKDGRMVQEITLPLLSKGDRHRVAVDISTLPRGVYFLIPNKGESEKFIILR
ncbi:MAG: T9SS type A sorting domain-containing protein, partial [candidate division WOR-3 bacterium]